MEINLNIESKEIEKDFQRIATDLMNSWVLKVENSQYRICEIEFYFQSKEHKDTYTHGHELQKKKGRWYFHGSGIDLTFGSSDIFGGILIRAIYDLDKERYIYGPLNTITELFGNLSTAYLKQFAFGLVYDSEKIMKTEKLIAAPRVGLNPNKIPEMYEKLYRFLIMPKKKHAEKTRIEHAMKIQDFSEEEIKNIWG
jgi:hypothetical protein